MPNMSLATRLVATTPRPNATVRLVGAMSEWELVAWSIRFVAAG